MLQRLHMFLYKNCVCKNSIILAARSTNIRDLAAEACALVLECVGISNDCTVFKLICSPNTIIVSVSILVCINRISWFFHILLLLWSALTIRNIFCSSKPPPLQEKYTLSLFSLLLHTHTHTHTNVLSLFHTHTLTHTFSLSLSHSHTHTLFLSFFWREKIY